MQNHHVWLTDYLSLEMRVEKHFLLGLKRVLLSWGWAGFETRVDLESKSLLIDCN